MAKRWYPKEDVPVPVEPTDKEKAEAVLALAIEETADAKKAYLESCTRVATAALSVDTMNEGLTNASRTLQFEKEARDAAMVNLNECVTAEQKAKLDVVAADAVLNERQAANRAKVEAVITKAKKR